MSENFQKWKESIFKIAPGCKEDWENYIKDAPKHISEHEEVTFPFFATGWLKSDQRWSNKYYNKINENMRHWFEFIQINFIIFVVLTIPVWYRLSSTIYLLGWLG